MRRAASCLSLALLLAACGAPPPPRRGAPSPAELKALLARGPGASIEVTRDSSDDALLRTRLLPAPAPLVVETLTQLAAGLPRWRVVTATDEVIWATHTTRLLHRVDDVYILVEPVGDAACAIRVRSASRGGGPDLGQNRRNIAELLRAMDAFLESHLDEHAHPGRREA